ncbi:methylenetetrahydrofolate reductase [Amycolatopsis acidiphila]|uniref:Methylenetetrahydrofolate reductase n=1 Tax=Amycolatopsis acidiphila TaxID=715473 RepID=A0A558A988_9PSEU|nr:methylenetetrahydrofolate reductase [Amycolatopsis acidiphila]TVT20823.1 5,10-methylenetetrahydrofolate reductase [Amycolatopsis acidiphila]UIJ58369.1 methylenetetrahydrofolate reductase [Amycolatopsis acidiphila]GHG93706.1 methylenetetrahydrofolate reductase [Amycolatopsis acidiphila]
MKSVVERLRGDAPVFSVEFFPPRDAADEAVLWRSIRELESLDPAYMSITYGAGGSSRDGTIRNIARAATETTLVPMAHLTAVNHSVAELRNVIGWYAAVGVRNILALRGDPPGDPYGDWVAHPQGLNYAEELVSLVRSLGDFCVGVSAFPYGHPRSPDLDTDTRYLVRKFNAGAEFGIAQLFFQPEDFLRLRDRVAAAGCDAMLIPGVMPLTTPRTLKTTIKLSGAPCPQSLLDRLEPLENDPKAFRAEGLDVVTELCERLIAEGVPDLHFYTFNRSKATREVVQRLGLVPARAQNPVAAGR